MPNKKILFVFGTRPEVIKLAPVINVVKNDGAFEPYLLHTGQHRELADEMLELFKLKADFNLSVMLPNQDLFNLTARILDGLKNFFDKNQFFDLIVVQGDTTSAFLGGLAGYYTKTPVAHVEAGLRTNDKFSPYPEEINRRLMSQLADIHFPPTEQAKKNLMLEGVPENRIVVTGNTVIDALLQALELDYSPSKELHTLFSLKGRLILVTTHRRENFGEPHREIFRALLDLVKTVNDVNILFPVHPNPNVRKEVAKILENHPRIYLTPPLGYLDFIHAMKNSYLILSDSGGVQEEAPTLKKPVLVLRNKTERPEGIQVGVLKLVGTRHDVILSTTIELLQNPEKYREMINKPNPYGDGKASFRILKTFKSFFENKCKLNS